MDRRFTVLVVTTAAVLATLWGAELFVTSALGLDLDLIIASIGVTAVMVLGDAAIWFLAFRSKPASELR